jgi:hypothetical protein
MNTRFRHSILLAVVGAVVGALGALIVLPAYVGEAETLALVIGGLAVYVLAAMAAAEYKGHRAFSPRPVRQPIASARRVVVRLPAGRRERERLAA